MDVTEEVAVVELVPGVEERAASDEGVFGSEGAISVVGLADMALDDSIVVLAVVVRERVGSYCRCLRVDVVVGGRPSVDLCFFAMSSNLPPAFTTSLFPYRNLLHACINLQDSDKVHSDTHKMYTLDTSSKERFAVHLERGHS